jgi:hypothetical protein
MARTRGDGTRRAGAIRRGAAPQSTRPQTMRDCRWPTTSKQGTGGHLLFSASRMVEAPGVAPGSEDRQHTGMGMSPNPSGGLRKPRFVAASPNTSVSVTSFYDKPQHLRDFCLPF